MPEYARLLVRDATRVADGYQPRYVSASGGRFEKDVRDRYSAYIFAAPNDDSALAFNFQLQPSGNYLIQAVHNSDDSIGCSWYGSICWETLTCINSSSIFWACTPNK